MINKSHFDSPILVDYNSGNAGQFRNIFCEALIVLISQNIP